MATTSEKEILILEQEKKFASSLAMQVLDRPKLSIWLIFIPILFVFYIYRYQRFTAGQKMFAENYLISRKRALNEALEVVKTGKEPDIDELAKLSDFQEDVHKRLAKLLGILVEHYTNLLRSEGESLESLVRSAYRNRTNYLLYVNQLNQAEKVLNATITPHLSKTQEGVNNIISTIEHYSEKLRRDSAEMIFP